MGRRLGAMLVCGLLVGCQSGGEESTGTDSFGSSASGSTGAPSGTTAVSGSTSSASMSSTSGPVATSSTSGGSSGDDPIFDVATQPDAPPVGGDCPDDAYMANDGNVCALYEIVYERDEGLLTLSVTLGQTFEITDPDVEVIFATEQMGYEGFFTVAREMDAPDVFYMLVSDDDFMHAAIDGTCAIATECESSCVAGSGGDVCRAFVDDFIPIVANAYVGMPVSVDTFGRRSSPDGSCCAEDIVCNYTINTYTEYVVTGPGGTMHFVFQDGFAFLDTMGWDHIERKSVTGDAEFEFDLCSLPVPEG